MLLLAWAISGAEDADTVLAMLREMEGDLDSESWRWLHADAMVTLTDRGAAILMAIKQHLPQARAL